MHAARTVGPSPETGHEAGGSTPETATDEAIALRVASAEDAATASPVHALHAQLAEALDHRPMRRFDTTRAALVVLALFYTVGAWWGLVSLGSVLVRRFIG